MNPTKWQAPYPSDLANRKWTLWYDIQLSLLGSFVLVFFFVLLLFLLSVFVFVQVYLRQKEREKEHEIGKWRCEQSLGEVSRVEI